VIKAVTPADQVDPKLLETNRLDALRGAKESFRLMALTEQVDEKTTPVAKVLIPEYIASEADPVKKEAAKIILADVYRVAGDSDNAILAYRQVLEASPDNLDAMSGLGFSLVNNGYIKDDKSQLQEGANYLQKFASAAPDTNKFKADALGLIESLKKDQNVAPAKVGGKKKN
jgi:tetratricopeptide (TPR) repeat protein